MRGQEANFKAFIADIYARVARVADSAAPEPELVRFAAAISRGTNNEETIRYRHVVLVRSYLQRFAPVDLDEDRVFSHDQKLAIFRRDEGHCQTCGRQLEFAVPDTHYHHLQAYVEGGTTEVANGQLVCRDCHLSKLHREVLD